MDQETRHVTRTTWPSLPFATMKLKFPNLERGLNTYESARAPRVHPTMNWTFKWRTSRAPRTSAVQHFISEVMSKLSIFCEWQGDTMDNVCPRVLQTMSKLKSFCGQGGTQRTMSVHTASGQDHRGKPIPAQLVKSLPSQAK